MGSTVKMYKETEVGRIEAPVPTALIEAHEHEGWILSPLSLATFSSSLDTAQTFVFDCTVSTPDTETGINPFYALLDRMREIHDAKNADYAASEDKFANFRESEGIGVPAFAGAFIRLGDKYRRIRNLVRRELVSGDGPMVASESIEDTLMDLAIYSLIVLQLHREYRETK